MKKKSDKPTIQDIAAKAGVSTATVSRALNKTGSVNEETLRKVLDAAHELQYPIPDLIPKKDAENESPHPDTGSADIRGLILVCVQDLSNSFYADIIKGIRSSVLSKEYEFLLYPNRISESSIQSFLSFALSIHTTGIITLDLIPSALLQKLTGFFPVVQCCEFTDNPYASSVGINDFTAVQTALEYLLSMGKRKICIINGPLSYRYAQNRLAAFQSIMNSYEIDVPPEWIIQLPDLNQDMAFTSVVKVLTNNQAPECIFTVSDVLAASAIRAVKYCNYQVPDDIMVIGFDNTIISQLTTPSITTINQPMLQLGFMAGDLLFEKIEHELSPVQHLLLKTELIIRESTTNTV